MNVEMVFDMFGRKKSKNNNFDHGRDDGKGEKQEHIAITSQVTHTTHKHTFARFNIYFKCFAL